MEREVRRVNDGEAGELLLAAAAPLVGEAVAAAAAAFHLEL